MRPFTHFLTPNGRGSVVEEGPWHYGIDYITVYFRADADLLQRLLPEKLRVVDGTAVAYVSEFVSVSERNPEAYFTDPAQTIYREAGIGVMCRYGEKTGVFYPFMWVDRDWAMIRGWLNGYPKKIADEILMTRFHKHNKLVGFPRPGVKMLGYCVRHGFRVLTVEVELEREGSGEDLIRFGSTFGLRHFPTTGENQTGIKELVEVVKTNTQASEIWVGKGRLTLGNSPAEEMDYVKPTEIIKGLHYKAGFIIEGAKVLEKL